MQSGTPDRNVRSVRTRVRKNQRATVSDGIYRRVSFRETGLHLIAKPETARNSEANVLGRLNHDFHYICCKNFNIIVFVTNKRI